MENFFGVDEDPAESVMEDATLMVAFVKARKAEQEKEEKAQALFERSQNTDLLTSTQATI